MTHIVQRPRHRADDAIADRDQRIQQLADDNATLIGANEDLVCELTRTLISGCQDAVRLARLETDYLAAVREVRRLQQKTIRDGANLERLRKAVVDARPRITHVVQRLDRPYVSHVQLPYPVPVGQSTANETAQQLPIVDQPEPGPWPTYSMRDAEAAS